METLFYLPASGQTYWSSELQANTGFSPDTNPGVLAANGIYTVNQTEPTADVQLYTSLPVYTIVGNYANQTWVATPRPLPTAKENGSSEAKENANSEQNLVVSASGFSNDTLTAVSSQDAFSRPTQVQDVLDQMTTISDNLGVTLTSIENATSVDEIDSILKGPSGIMVTGRGGAGPLDMQPSYFTDLLNLPPGVGEPELEIYIPGTDTVIPYDAGLPAPYKFDSMGNCYTGTDYRTVIRVAATGQVLSTVIPALGPAVPIAWTYNPVIPSTGGSSSHSA